jgi:hypothetical protein
LNSHSWHPVSFLLLAHGAVWTKSLNSANPHVSMGIGQVPGTGHYASGDGERTETEEIRRMKEKT